MDSRWYFCNLIIGLICPSYPCLFKMYTSNFISYLSYYISTPAFVGAGLVTCLTEWLGPCFNKLSKVPWTHYENVLTWETSCSKERGMWITDAPHGLKPTQIMLGWIKLSHWAKLRRQKSQHQNKIDALDNDHQKWLFYLFELWKVLVNSNRNTCNTL